MIELPPLHIARINHKAPWDSLVRVGDVTARERIFQARIAELERLWQSAEARYAEVDAAAMSHAKRIAEQDHVIAIARQNAELLTGYWKAAVAETKALRNRLREAGLLEEDDDVDGW